jgi:hypothetical protein
MTNHNNFRPLPERTAPYLHFQMCSICHGWHCCKKEGPMHLCEGCADSTMVLFPKAERSLAVQRPSQQRVHQFGSPHADWRQRNTFRASRHLKLRLWGAERGSEAERTAKRLFHGVLKEHFDRMDYPVDPFYRPEDTHPTCSICGGLVWYTGNREPKFLRRLAHQVGLRIAVDQWRLGSKCPEWEEVLRPTVELEGSLL